MLKTSEEKEKPVNGRHRCGTCGHFIVDPSLNRHILGNVDPQQTLSIGKLQKIAYSDEGLVEGMRGRQCAKGHPDIAPFERRTSRDICDTDNYVVRNIGWRRRRT